MTDLPCVYNVGSNSKDGLIYCAAPQSAPLHNPHDIERFQHEYTTPIPELCSSTYKGDKCILGKGHSVQHCGERESWPLDYNVDIVAQLPKRLRDIAKGGCPLLYPDQQSALKTAANELEYLKTTINNAINYCYKFEAEHEAGHPGVGALIPIWQDLQAAVGR